MSVTITTEKTALGAHATGYQGKRSPCTANLAVSRCGHKKPRKQQQDNNRYQGVTCAEVQRRFSELIDRQDVGLALDKQLDDF